MIANLLHQETPGSLSISARNLDSHDKREETVQGMLGRQSYWSSLCSHCKERRLCRDCRGIRLSAANASAYGSKDLAIINDRHGDYVMLWYNNITGFIRLISLLD